MTGPEHLIAWAESDRALYLALCDLERRSRADAPDGFLGALGRYYAASNIVASSYSRATRCGDMFREDITAEDLAQAVEDALAWRKEA